MPFNYERAEAWRKHPLLTGGFRHAVRAPPPPGQRPPRALPRGFGGTSKGCPRLAAGGGGGAGAGGADPLTFAQVPGFFLGGVLFAAYVGAETLLGPKKEKH